MCGTKASLALPVQNVSTSSQVRIVTSHESKGVIGSDAKQTKAIQVPQKYETVGQVTTFQIQSRNVNGVNNTSGGDNYDVQAEGPSSLSDLLVRYSTNPLVVTLLTCIVETHLMASIRSASHHSKQARTPFIFR